MAQEQKPGICFVAGAWHTPFHHEVIKSKLEARGFEVLVPKLPSCSDDASRTWKDDVTEIQRVVTPSMDRGKEFILVAHSYGGIPACSATPGYTVSERIEQGKQGGFRAVLFISALVVFKPGMDLLGTLGGSYLPCVKSGELYKGNQLSFVAAEGKEALYNDLSDDDAQRYFDALSPHAQDAFETPVDFAATQLKIPATYLLCEGDAAAPLHFQENIAAGLPGIKIERCTAGHCPFISQPDRVIEILEKL